MKLTHVKGNTYVLEGWGMIPLYKLDDTHCILLDCGLTEERGKIEETLAENNLTLVGIIVSHAHGTPPSYHTIFSLSRLGLNFLARMKQYEITTFI